MSHAVSLKFFIAATMALVPRASGNLIRKREDNALMPPPPKRIKRPKNVIDEESYTDAISEIIARDFFPGLLQTETQQEYLDALESRDSAWISSASRRLQHVMTPGRRQGRRGTSIQTPARVVTETPRTSGADTPMSSMSDVSVTRQVQQPEVNINMSLDKFQSLYTSEDNESFYKLIDKQNQKKAEKYAWMWTGNNKKPSMMMLKQKEIEKKLVESGRSIQDDGGKRDRLAISDRAEKPATPDSWKYKPNNEIMFAPDSVEDSVETIAQKAQSDSRAAPKSVAYANTRLPNIDMVAEESRVTSSPSLSAVRDAIAGHRTMTESGYNGSETPRVNGYAFVDDEPEEEEYVHPITITMSKGDATKNPFVIKEQSKREDLHHRIVDARARSNRISQRQGLIGRVEATPVPKFPSSPRVNSGQLTPAAQRLWSKVGSSGGDGAAFGTRTSHTSKSKSGLRTKWTPITK